MKDLWCIAELCGDGEWRPNRAMGTFTKRKDALRCAIELQEDAKLRAFRADAVEARMFARRLGVKLHRYKNRVVRCRIVLIEQTKET